MQTKLIKSAVRVHTFCRNTPLLNALGIRTIETSLDISCLELLRTVFNVKSRAKQFYKHLMNVYIYVIIKHLVGVVALLLERMLSAKSMIFLLLNIL